MATTFIEFVPSQTVAPSYQVTLDGAIYTMTIEWVLQPQRYYIRLATLEGETVLYTALTGSPIGIDIEEMTWSNGKVTVKTAVEHKFRIGQVMNLTVTGCVPTAYNGVVQMLATGRDTLTYLLSTDPGEATVFGAVQENIDLVASLFTSTLVYRQSNKRFEVSDG